MSGLRVCVVLFCMIVMTTHPTQRSLCALSEPSTVSFWKEKHRNLLFVFPRREAIATAITSDPGFVTLCNIIKESYAN